MLPRIGVISAFFKLFSLSTFLLVAAPSQLGR